MKRKRLEFGCRVDVAFVIAICVALGACVPIVFPQEDPPCEKGFLCRDITLCAQGIAEVRRGGRPHICGWNRHVAKVCCPDNPDADDEDPFFTALIGFQRNEQCGVLIVPQVNASAIANKTTTSAKTLTTLNPKVKSTVAGTTRRNKQRRHGATATQHRPTAPKPRGTTSKPKVRHLPITDHTSSTTTSRSSANFPHNQVSSRRVQNVVPTALPAQGRRLPHQHRQRDQHEYQFYEQHQQHEQHYSVFNSHQAVNGQNLYSAPQVDNTGQFKEMYKDPGLWDPDFFSPGDHGGPRVPGWFAPYGALRKRNARETLDLEEESNETKFEEELAEDKSNGSRIEEELDQPKMEDKSNGSELGEELDQTKRKERSNEFRLEEELDQTKLKDKSNGSEVEDVLDEPKFESLKIAGPSGPVSGAYRRRARVDANNNNGNQPEKTAKKTGKVDARVPDPDILKAIGPAVSFVIGGAKADYNTWPWMASILRGSELKFLCGGFLINDRYVLSAAHCFQGQRSTQTYGVRLGQIRYDEGPVYKVERFVVHEDYVRRQYYNDIALIRLAEPVPLALIRPVCLPTPVMARQNLIGREATVLGWGDTMFGGPRSDTLQEVNGLPIVDVRKCNESYSKLRGNPFSRGITKEFICAGLMQGGKDACQGDSGGPLMLEHEGRWTAVGIVSFGYRCGEPGFPGVYTRISRHLRWIDNNIFMDSIGYNTIV
ncbi:uncharacterized protein LOC135368969 [Ornithodoros turicata]|uniref:uncharacterized protein LOC135368969 n=1 Tax=Ornithodoros turicata TaxID=34597 RepID=UPI00313A0CF2